MRRHLNPFRTAVGAALLALPLLVSSVRGADTMADWVGSNTTTGANNYSVISPTSAGGQFQSRVNFVNDPNQGHQYYLSDPTLTVPLSFNDELHMSGTVTFSAPINSNHNWFFGWYNSSDTRFRIGLGVQSTTRPAENNWIRWDFGYAATGVLGNNLFRSPTTDGGTSSPIPDGAPQHYTDLPDGTYPFTFDYIPGPSGKMSVTVGDLFRDEGPVPALADVFTVLDRFGFVQRTTSVTDPTIFFNMVVSNVTYTGGTAAPLLGDVNNDGVVDIFDVNLVSDHWGETGPLGDANNDGAVDIFDVNVISDNWTGSGVAAVPEPASLALAGAGLVGFAALALVRRRQAA